MAKAIWNGVVIAESDKTIRVEGNLYFPPDSVKKEYFRQSDEQTFCAWKGTASYYDIVVDDKVNRGGAWYYPTPSSAARQIKNHVAFWRGVQVQV